METLLDLFQSDHSKPFFDILADLTVDPYEMYVTIIYSII